MKKKVTGDAKALAAPYKKIFFRNNRLRFCAALLATALSETDVLLMSWMLGAVMDTAAAGDGGRLLRLLVVTAVILLGFGLIYLVRDRCKSGFVRRAMEQYKSLAFTRLSQKSISAFSEESTGRYISVLTNDVTTVETDYLLGSVALIRLVLSAVGALAMMLFYSPLLTLILVPLCLPSLLVSLLMGNEMSARTRRVSDENESFVARVKDLLSGFTVIKSFKAESRSCGIFDGSSAELEEAKYRKRWWQYALEDAGSICGCFMQFGIFFVGAVMAIRGEITSGTVLIFVNLCNPLMRAVQYIPQYWAEYRAAGGLVEKLASVLEENSGRSGEEIEPVLNDAIVLKDLSFGYGEGKMVLKNLDMELRSGKKYALVGASGSGKSTLLNLLMGAYDSYTGSITVDGRELRSIDPDSLYDLECLVGQNVFLFDDSIRSNITMFSDFPDNQVASAAERSGLKALMDEKGGDYSCGENGVKLSGGERQRVSIARCLLRGSPVLLMDEATAALDNKTSFEVVNSILALEGLTRLVVTHRLERELLEQYDEIFVLRSGEICERGRFAELMEQKGTFYALYTLSA